MESAVVRQRNPWALLPLAGSVLFAVLYVVAAALYPGGSGVDAHSKGFSWLHNYWCNLLNEKAINGQLNAGRSFAYLALFCLAASLLSFWVLAAQGFGFSKRSKIFLLACGAVCLLLLPFLPTAFHDSVINLSASAGLLAMGLVYAALYRKGWRGLFWFGVFNLLLVALNNYLYYCTSLYYLPVVQKFTFFSFLLWVCAVSLKLYRQPGRS